MTAPVRPLAALLEQVADFIESVSDFRAPDGSLPFNIVDYHIMDQFVTDLRQAADRATSGRATGSGHAWMCPGPQECSADAAVRDLSLAWYRPEGGGQLVLSGHWLYQMECRHDAKQDIAHCACGWSSRVAYSVGEAAFFWAEHAMKIMQEVRVDTERRAALAARPQGVRDGIPPVEQR